MSILSKWVGQRQPYIERELEEKYTQMISLLPTGMTCKQIRKKVKEAIKLCKEKGIKEGTSNLPPDYGKLLIRAAEAGDLDAKKIVDKARSEGATDEDIGEFWNLGDLERRMIGFYENIFRLAMIRSLRKPGLSEDGEKEIEVEVRKMSPVYGDTDNTAVTSGRDRPLPYELRVRVERWRTKLIYECGEKRLKEKAGRYSTFNTLVRVEIQKGNL